MAPVPDVDACSDAGLLAANLTFALASVSVPPGAATLAGYLNPKPYTFNPTPHNTNLTPRTQNPDPTP